MADCVLFWGWEWRRRTTGLNTRESFKLSPKFSTEGSAKL